MDTIVSKPKRRPESKYSTKCLSGCCLSSIPNLSTSTGDIQASTSFVSSQILFDLGKLLFNCLDWTLGCLNSL